MKHARRAVGWLEARSDVLSPLLVKEVRQLVRGREFMLSLAASLTVALAIAFFGAADALQGGGTTGNWTFGALVGCLAFLGLAVVPLAAFSALRNERMEQTLELITLTSLSSRRIVIGKLLSSAVKLVTLFAAIAPFITMSFLLGGIDFVTILASLALLFMGSLWVSALCLFLSTTKSRAVSVLVFGIVGIVAIFLIVIGRTIFMTASRGVLVGGGPFGFMLGGSSWGTSLVVAFTFWIASLINLVLLAENRLALPTEDSVTPLRIGFFVQFLLIVGWALSCINDLALRVPASQNLAIFGSAHLAIVATFVVTEEMELSRRMVYRMRAPSMWRWLLVMFGPGAGRGAAYVLPQMLMLVVAVRVLHPGGYDMHAVAAVCGYILFFTGGPTLAFWLLAPAKATPIRLRVTALITLAVAMVVPDLLYYVILRPETVDLSYSLQHVINPVRTISNWEFVESAGWTPLPLAIGLTGLVAYFALIWIGARTLQPVPVDPYRPAPVAGDAGRGDVLY